MKHILNYTRILVTVLEKWQFFFQQLFQNIKTGWASTFNQVDVKVHG